MALEMAMWVVSSSHLGSDSQGSQTLSCLQYFIRLATASTIARRMKYLHEPLSIAAKACVEELRRDGGIGGVIVLDNAGNGELLIHSRVAFAHFAYLWHEQCRCR